MLECIQRCILISVLFSFFFNVMHSNLWVIKSELMSAISHAEETLIHCCIHHPHNQLLGEANFVNQCAARHLFSGHLELCKTKSQTHTHEEVCFLCDTSRGGCFLTHSGTGCSVVMVMWIFTPRPCVLVKRGIGALRCVGVELSL